MGSPSAMGELLPKKRRRAGLVVLPARLSNVEAICVGCECPIATNIYLARASDAADKSPKTNKEEPRRPGIEESSRINRDCGHQA
jgi:hypothetical protein